MNILNNSTKLTSKVSSFSVSKHKTYLKQIFIENPKTINKRPIYPGGGIFISDSGDSGIFTLEFNSVFS